MPRKRASDIPATPDLFETQEETAPAPDEPEAVPAEPAPAGEAPDAAEPTGEEPAAVAPPSEPEPEPEGGLPALMREPLGRPDYDRGELTLARYASRAYLEYSLSVVKGRALPDLFDGLKPVQRRILYAMRRLRLGPEERYSKSARVVGEVIGKYHPHGDQAAYDAMVRLAQPFTMRYPLVDGKGNFGSRDGDGPAAMRYTEVKLRRAAALLLDEIDSGAVPFIPNYDGTLREPTALPARLPMVLLNGASGIAVGMATEIPPHNLREVAEATRLRLREPDCGLDQLLAVMPAPDFPGGGQIISSPEEIARAYCVGRGSLRARARYHFEELRRGQWQLVIDELPPGASAEGVLAEIEDIVNPRPRAGKKVVSAEQHSAKQALLALLERARNECDSQRPTRLVFEPKSSRVDRQALLSALLGQTSLERSVPLNLVMVGDDGRPAQKGLPAILDEWLTARRRAVRARSAARLEWVLERLHILDGRVICCDHIERVIEIIRHDPEPAATLARELGLSERQVADILELRLRQISALEYDKVRREIKALTVERARLEKILGSERELDRVIGREIGEAERAFGDERRTLVEPAERASHRADLPAEPVTVIISANGYARFRAGHELDLSLLNFKVGDSLWRSFECQSSDTLVVLSDDGRAFSLPVAQLPTGRGDGAPLTNFFDFAPGHAPVGCLVGSGEEELVLASDAGLGLRCRLGDLFARPRGGKLFMRLGEGERLLPPRLIGPGQSWLACLGGASRLLVFPLSELRELRVGGRGVTLMELAPRERLSAALTIGEEGLAVTGQGRTTARRKKLSGPEWRRFLGRRARKGRPLELRFAARGLTDPDDEPSPAS